MILYNSIYLCFIMLCTSTFHFSKSLKNNNTPCEQFSRCKCIFPTGRGINLHAINETFNISGNGNTRIILHLCENISFGTNVASNQCFNNVSLCLEDSANNHSVDLGTAEQMKILSESQFKPIKLQFENGGKITNIVLTCIEENSEPNLIFKEADGTTFDLELRSREACVKQMFGEEVPGSMSWGSVLVLLLLMGTFVYLVVGIITLKYVRGAVGWEMVPNIEFWMDLPYLVRDGILFTLNGFRPPPSYDRI